jgi:hypothetical protein
MPLCRAVFGEKNSGAAQLSPEFQSALVKKTPLADSDAVVSPQFHPQSALSPSTAGSAGVGGGPSGAGGGSEG